MNTESEIKELVKEKYAAIAEQSQTQNATSCCGATSSCCGDEVYNIMSDDYTKLEGYNPDADLGLGCGLPTEFAKIKAGDTAIIVRKLFNFFCGHIRTVKGLAAITLGTEIDVFFIFAPHQVSFIAIKMNVCFIFYRTHQWNNS